MSRVVRIVAPVALMGLMFLSIGCNEPNVKANEQEQAARAAEERIRELENKLAQAHAMSEQDRIAAQEEQNRLRAEIEKLRNQLAQKPEPAPAAPAGWTNVPGGVMTSIEGTVLFDSGKAVLKPNARQTLADVVRVLQEKYPDRDIYVFGHTDNQPIRHSKWQDNYQLSCERALAVVRHLRSQGLRQKMSAAGWGEHMPVSDNSTTQSRQQNRRVEIYAMRPLKEVTGSASVSTPPNR